MAGYAMRPWPSRSAKSRWGVIFVPFLDVVDDIYRDDPMLRAPARHRHEGSAEQEEPVLRARRGTCFAAFRDGKCVGRITAQIDAQHLERYKDDAGFFGFLDTIDDAEVARRCSIGPRTGSRAGHEAHPRPALAQHQRGVGLPGRGLRHAADGL